MFITKKRVNRVLDAKEDWTIQNLAKEGGTIGQASEIVRLFQGIRREL
jgi:hypothetical protein